MDFKVGQKVVVVNTKYAFFDIPYMEGYIGIATYYGVDGSRDNAPVARLDGTQIIVKADKESNLAFIDPEKYFENAESARKDIEFKLKRCNVALYDLDMALDFNKSLEKKTK